MDPLRLFIVTAPGVEAFTAQELAACGLPVQPGSAQPAAQGGEETGGITLPGDLTAIYRANLHLRTASRVLVRMGEFHATAFSELRKKASRLPWGQFLRPGTPLAVRATCRHSRLYHSDAVAERVAGAISDALGRPSPWARADEDAAEPPQLIIARLVNDQVTLSLDSSGAHLHRRGYRLATAKAPLRETLAAAVLLASGWDGRSPLLDPFCGSGTLLIEAALLARRMAPGKHRRFAFQNWVNYDPRLWKNLFEEASAQEIPCPAVLQGSDRDAGAVQSAQANAERAGVAADLNLSCLAVSALSAPAGPGWVVTNPPYGQRISSTADLRNLYARFGQVLREQCPGWQAAILCNSEALVRQTRLAYEKGIPFVNGGLPVHLTRARVPQESHS